MPNTFNLKSESLRITKRGTTLSLSITLILFFCSFFYSSVASAQCPSGTGWFLDSRDYPHPTIPGCTITIHFCWREWGSSGPPDPDRSLNHVEISVHDIDYIGCNGDDRDTFDWYAEDLMDDILTASEMIPNNPCFLANDEPNPDLPILVRLYAGDCRTQPIYIGQVTAYDEQGNPYIKNRYTSKNCSVASQNCESLFKVCRDALGNILYYRVSSTPPLQMTCGTTTIYCAAPACFPGGEITVPCNPFCY